MKRNLLVLLIYFGFPFFAFSQFRWDVGFNMGASNYLGEMGGKENTRKDFIADLKLSQTKFTGGGFVRYKINPSVYLKANLQYARISGDDKLCSNLGRNGTNLSFRNDIFELSVTSEFTFYYENDIGGAWRFRNDFRSYVFGGLAGFKHNPKTFYNGDWVALRPLKTEGQTKAYSKFGVAIPVGVGFSFTVNKQFRFGWEMGWRTTFTDYLDDVSTVYADPGNLSSPLAVALANRTDELVVDQAFANNFTTGNKRGDPTHNDSYMFMTVSFSWVIQGHSKEWGKRKAIYGHYFNQDKLIKRKKPRFRG